MGIIANLNLQQSGATAFHKKKNQNAVKSRRSLVTEQMLEALKTPPKEIFFTQQIQKLATPVTYSGDISDNGMVDKADRQPRRNNRFYTMFYCLREHVELKLKMVAEAKVPQKDKSQKPAMDNFFDKLKTTKHHSETRRMKGSLKAMLESLQIIIL